MTKNPTFLFFKKPFSATRIKSEWKKKSERNVEKANKYPKDRDEKDKHTEIGGLFRIPKQTILSKVLHFLVGKKFFKVHPTLVITFLKGLSKYVFTIKNINY